jgi:hypothetical protein
MEDGRWESKNPIFYLPTAIYNTRMSIPSPKPHLRYAELKEWLFANGVSQYKLRSLVAQGVIKPNYVGGGYAYYNADQIKRDVLDPMDGPETQAARLPLQGGL